MDDFVERRTRCHAKNITVRELESLNQSYNEGRKTREFESCSTDADALGASQKHKYPS
jgi:hypothetical protein